ncbi:MAG TPA: ATP synthase F1 subunit gamma [Elusimicrobia bacterium]|nr:ATP synthase F1 subunit gamma [Elusimicrobiota bacterium]
MASLREIRRKIKSVKSTEQITKAMKMIAAARMRRAQASILSSRPFAARMEEAVRDLAALDASPGVDFEHPFFQPGPAGAAECLILVTADKGLCGAFNTNVLKAGIEWLRARQGKPVMLACVGRKARDFAARLKGINVLCELVGIFPRASYAHAEILGQAVSGAFLEGRSRSVTAIFNEFRSVLSQRVVERPLLPIPVPEKAAKAADFRFEPEREQLLAALLPRHLKAQLYRILLESQAAELAARMNAMDSASRNARELIDALTLNLNRTRQSLITLEITELVGGAEALSN